MAKHDIKPTALYDRFNIAAAPTGNEVNDLANYFDGLEKRIAQLNDSYETLQKRWVELTEHRWVLLKSGAIFDEAGGQAEQIRSSMDEDEDAGTGLLSAMDRSEAQPEPVAAGYRFHGVGVVAGVINTEKISLLERTLWRALRGNLFMRQAAIDEVIRDPKTNEEVKKTVFVIFAHGAGVLARIRRLA